MLQAVGRRLGPGLGASAFRRIVQPASSGPALSSGLLSLCTPVLETRLLSTRTSPAPKKGGVQAKAAAPRPKQGKKVASDTRNKRKQTAKKPSKGVGGVWINATQEKGLAGTWKELEALESRSYTKRYHSLRLIEQNLYGDQVRKELLVHPRWVSAPDRVHPLRCAQARMTRGDYLQLIEQYVE